MLCQLFLVFSTVQACNTARTTPCNTIVDIAIKTPSLSTLVTALKAADLVKKFDGHGSFTVFAPTNDAFSALPKGALAKFLKPGNKAKLIDVLAYHVLVDEVFADDFLDGEMLKTLETKYVTARIAGKNIFINSAKITIANVTASNGVIHIIDAVLLPHGPAPQPRPTPSPPAPPTPANHLWFRGFTEIYGGHYQCGEIDAAPRMPAAIFEPNNKAALRAYAQVTLSLYQYVTPLYSQDVHLELGRCADLGYTMQNTYARKTNWAPNVLMSGICAAKCKCQFCDPKPSRSFPCPSSSILPKCQDEPDDPSAGKFCSLCGPKFNEPIAVKSFQCSKKNFPCRGPKDKRSSLRGSVNNQFPTVFG